ncbi:MAG: glycoside hydrolase family 76 protein [Sediminicola sp.]
MKRRKFIGTAGSYGLLIGGLGTFASCADLVPDRAQRLKDMSMKAFKRFEKVWDFPDFWKRGNTFDACLTFVATLDKRWPDSPEVGEIKKRVTTMLEKNLDFFKSYDSDTLWADDFGWWGLMALNARKHLLKEGNRELSDTYWNLATDLCWEYKRKTAYDHTDTASPVPHGCRNGDANGASKGVKNTVTNVLLFLLSSRIYRESLQAGDDPENKYLEMAYAQWQWFEQWFSMPKYRYLKWMGGGAALVQERPMADFDGSDYREMVHPPWAPGWVWSGDQGMLLAALSDMLFIKDRLTHFLIDEKKEPGFEPLVFEQRVRECISAVGKGIKMALVGNSDGIIREAPCLSSFGPNHGNDYVAGRGIMVRYIGAGEIKGLLGVELDGPIRKSMEAIWETRNPEIDQFQPEFTSLENDGLYIEQFRKLWGMADPVHKWDLEKMKEKNRLGVCQAIGLDMLGAAIGTL